MDAGHAIHAPDGQFNLVDVDVSGCRLQHVYAGQYKCDPQTLLRCVVAMFMVTHRVNLQIILHTPFRRQNRVARPWQTR
ncbi:MAG: hypothetical protein HY650_11550 [Acidobacteria bacterium]|nr:hypothetical protein [Acidobacteriota bacterium]